MKRVLQAVLVIVLVGLTVLATTGASGEHPMEKVEGKLDGQKVRVNLPPTTDPKGVAIYFHGQGGNYSAKMGSGWLDALRRDGWAVASSNFHGANWGNPASTSDLEKLWDWAEEQSGGEVKLFIAGSMGGVTSLNSIVHSSKGAPACWYGVKTATDMTTMGAVPGARRFISQAYGGQPFPRDRNPANTAFKLANTGTTYRFVHSRFDPLVPYDANTGSFTTRLTEFGADVSVRQVQGAHDDASHYSAYDLVSFANTCAGTEQTEQASAE